MPIVSFPNPVDDYAPPARQTSPKNKGLVFASDNNAGCMPGVIEALQRCNDEEEASPAYGLDRYSCEMLQEVRQVFEHESLQCYLVCTGTASNCLAITQLLNGDVGAVCCADIAHIVTDECGAPEYFTGGQVMRTLKSDPTGKITPDTLINHVHSIPATVHRSPPRVLSLSNTTEVGTLYTCEEVKALCDTAHMLGLTVHLDGSRLANAIAALECSPADLTWRAGVDALSLGLTKAGGMMSEGIVFFDKKFTVGFEHRQKRAAQLVSKCRYMAVQTTALLRDDLWIKGARHANRMASYLAGLLEKKFRFLLLYPCQANEIFCIFPEYTLVYLKEAGVRYYVYPIETFGVCTPFKSTKVARLLTHFATHQEDIDKLIEYIDQSLEEQESYQLGLTKSPCPLRKVTCSESVASTPSVAADPISPFAV